MKVTATSRTGSRLRAGAIGLARAETVRDDSRTVRDARLRHREEGARRHGRRTALGSPSGQGRRAELHTGKVHPGRASPVCTAPSVCPPGQKYSARMTRSEEAVCCRHGGFRGSADLTFNRGLRPDPEAVATDADAASWLFLCGDDFAAVERGMSNARVQAAVAETAWIVSDPPKVLDIDLARQLIAALDRLPRPTLVACRTRPGSSALVYLYSGLKAGAQTDDVRARANADDAPLARSDEITAWGRSRSQRTCLTPGMRSFACASVLPSRAVYGAAIPRYGVLTVPPRT